MSKDWQPNHGTTNPNKEEQIRQLYDDTSTVYVHTVECYFGLACDGATNESNSDTSLQAAREFYDAGWRYVLYDAAFATMCPACLEYTGIKDDYNDPSTTGHDTDPQLANTTDNPS